VVHLRFIISIVCCLDSYLCQNRDQRRGHRFSHCSKDSCGSGFSLGNYLFQRRNKFNFFLLTKNNIIFLILSGTATGLSWIFYFKALQLGKVSQVAPVDKLSVAIAIIFSAIFLGETLTFKTALGAVLILLGTIIIIL